eukprot:COSAG06_NODE_392_length_16344_cov_4.086981_10_plen_92_part_00
MKFSVSTFFDVFPAAPPVVKRVLTTAARTTTAVRVHNGAPPLPPFRLRKRQTTATCPDTTAYINAGADAERWRRGGPRELAQERPLPAAAP